MKILFLHGWHSTPGGLKPTYLKDHGHTVLNPALPGDDFQKAIAQAEYDPGQPDVVVGSSRGGAVAMNIDPKNTPLVLLCPDWKTWGTSVVRYGTTNDYDHEVRVEGSTTLHHVEIPIPERDTTYHYSVSTGDQTSPDATFKAYPSGVFRVAVVADWRGRPDLPGLIKDDMHLLLTAGDNISNTHRLCGPGNKDCIKPYAALNFGHGNDLAGVPSARQEVGPFPLVRESDGGAVCKLVRQPLPAQPDRWQLCVRSAHR